MLCLCSVVCNACRPLEAGPLFIGGVADEQRLVGLGACRGAEPAIQTLSAAGEWGEKEKRMRPPGIEPGSAADKAEALPLCYRRDLAGRVSGSSYSVYSAADFASFARLACASIQSSVRSLSVVSRSVAMITGVGVCRFFSLSSVCLSWAVYIPSYDPSARITTAASPEVQWIGYSAVYRVVRVQFPAGESFAFSQGRTELRINACI